MVYAKGTMTQLLLCQLLAQWSKVEPQRCRQRNAHSFEVIYQGDWYSVADYPGSHGMIIAALLDSCQEHQISCCIRYLPQASEGLVQLQVSCQPDPGGDDQKGENLSQLPSLLLQEYLIALKQKQIAFAQGECQSPLTQSRN